MITGTLINTSSVVLGSSVGLLLGRRLPERITKMIIVVIGAVTIVMGFQMALGTKNILIVLVSLLVGTIFGEFLGIDENLERLSQSLQRNLRGSKTKTGDFTKAFVTTSLLFCVGPLTILGSIQDGLTGDYHLLAVKSVLDGISSFIFSSALGMGVIFSAATVFFLQGGISLGAWFFQEVLTQAMINEFSATGGVILFFLGLKILEIKETKVASTLPSLLFAPLIVSLFARFGISL